ncbi:hypothetical protein S7711_09920 [Stachybotrys chartarum IBT 7711]|uniref:HECT-type E3 ubiquitin transferase n=1 Tax=Stachybotrys chartarum (strain CBS 109288 / IBT 7711) TaxID=1280523 RepID=A0A084AG31_STACB|nr:hypothetical protein S7711_09920 [Stachybotrys chartarum IBT 7711]
MFSTFTGSSRRPRNVNLSGQAGNPFANTSWTPSAVSNATKTVTDAQAEREKRQLERQRQKAVAKIQRTWRGHRARRNLADSRRASFDALYQSNTPEGPRIDISAALSLLLSFASPGRIDDIDRVLHFVNDCNTRDVNGTELSALLPTRIHSSRIGRLVKLLVDTLNTLVSTNSTSTETAWPLLHLITSIATLHPAAIQASVDVFFSALACLCHPVTASNGIAIPLEPFLNSFRIIQGSGVDIYHALAFRFLTVGHLLLFEQNIESFAAVIQLDKLCDAITNGYSSSALGTVSNDDMLWLLAHFHHLGKESIDTSRNFRYLNALYTQASALSSEISGRLRMKALSESSELANGQHQQPFEPYVFAQLMSLVDHAAISRLLSDFSNNLMESSPQDFEGTGLLAGYLLCLLQSFPSDADGTRMRLFLEQIPTTAGEVPIVKFLWEIMRQTSVFRSLKSDTAAPIPTLRNYLHGGSQSSRSAIENQEWPVILLFLELYIFVLRLSDDEDFFSGIRPRVLDTNSSTTRIRSCSLALDDVKALSSFLKNTAFSLHYHTQEISQSTPHHMSAKRRLDAYPVAETSHSSHPKAQHGTKANALATLDIDSLRAIITTTLKMIYERDSRDRFLPSDHWLMTKKLDKDDFISAVIAEEERQREEEDEASDGVDADSDDELVAGPMFYSTVAGQRLSRHARLERLKAQQSRLQKERRMAELGPKLEILKHMPFVVPFETRVMIFRQFILLDRTRRDGGTPFIAMPFARHHAKIRRGQLFEDAYEQFYGLGDQLKDPIQITFVDQFDTPEAGIDGGGVTKEFLTSVTSEAFGDSGTGTGMFSASSSGLLYPNPVALDVLRETLRQRGVNETDEEWKTAIHELFRRYEFLGRIVGKCLYEGILVDLAFAGFFLLKWPSSGAGEENSYKGSVNDLRDMDEDLYKGMLRLKNFPGDVSELGIDFTITDQVSPPGQPVKTASRKLVPNGDQVYVTNDNRLLYISYVARHRLVVQPSPQTNAFLRGLRAIIRPSWLSMFNQSELQRLVGGDSTEIDIEDLRRNTVYSGLYEIGDDNEEHPTIKLFWKVLEGFTDAQRRDVLKYVSSTPRAPLLGFSQLRPKFSIRDGGTDEERLPSTSTCVNLLKLPRYTRESTMREKLLYAITSGAGFDLS